MGRGAEALIIAGLSILGAGARFGAQLSMDKIPVTADPNICAIVANEGLNLRSMPSTRDNSPIGSLTAQERLPYTGSVARVLGENVDPNRSDGADWLRFTTVDGRLVFVSGTLASNSCPERTIAGEGIR